MEVCAYTTRSALPRWVRANSSTDVGVASCKYGCRVKPRVPGGAGAGRDGYLDGDGLGVEDWEGDGDRDGIDAVALLVALRVTVTLGLLLLLDVTVGDPELLGVRVADLVAVEEGETDWDPEVLGVREDDALALVVRLLLADTL